MVDMVKIYVANNPIMHCTVLSVSSFQFSVD